MHHEGGLQLQCVDTVPTRTDTVPIRTDTRADTESWPGIDRVSTPSERIGQVSIPRVGIDTPGRHRVDTRPPLIPVFNCACLRF